VEHQGGAAAPAVVAGHEASGEGRPRLEDLYAASAPRAVRLAYLLTGDRGVAEDVVQDAFVRVAGRLAHLRAPEAFDAYLRRAVVNLAKNHFRRRAVERAFLARARPVDRVAAPEGAIVERHAVVAALGRLSERQRAAIVLRYYEDQPEDAIAAVLRCRPGTVRSLISRGVATLRDELDPGAIGGGHD